MRLTIVGLIAFTAAMALLLGYQGLFHIVTGQFAAAGTYFGWAIPLIAGSAGLIKYRGDLLGEVI